MMRTITKIAAMSGGVAIFAAIPMQPCSARTDPPHLVEIVPASGPAGTAYPLQATIYGTGFMPAGNVVAFGPVKIADVASANHVSITFQVPKLVASRSEVPPMVLTPGKYSVTVTTSAGTSNSLMFTLTRGLRP
jgi:IPT/TIG domain